MKKIIFIVLALYSVYLLGIITYPFTRNDTMTVGEVTKNMTETWQKVVIKEKGYILYVGYVESIDIDLLNKEVITIANCEDDFAITLIVEEE